MRIDQLFEFRVALDQCIREFLKPFHEYDQKYPVKLDGMTIESIDVCINAEPTAYDKTGRLAKNPALNPVRCFIKL